MSNDNSNESKDTSDMNAAKKRGVPKSYIWAAAILFAMTAWMGSRFVTTGSMSANGHTASSVAGDAEKNEGGSTAKTETTKKKKLFIVEAKTFEAQKRRANLTIRGRTEVDSRVDVKAETAGIVEQVSGKKGKWVKKGELLCRIQTGEREASLLQAKANLAKAKADYQANRVLARKGHTAQLRVTTLKAQLDAAKAELKRAELNMARTSVRAPFDGFIEAQPAKVGDFLSIGSSCATLVALHPLVVTGAVSELEVVGLKTGMDAHVKFVTDQVKSGKIRFISSTADQNTRTFRIEVEIENKNANLRDGLSADIGIPLKVTSAHRFSPAILVLNDDGKIGVRTVDDSGLVKFSQVKLLSDSPQGVWVAGLPQTVRVITVGQEYVVHGQKVRVVEASRKAKKVDQGS